MFWIGLDWRWWKEMEVGTEGRRGWIVVLPGEVTLAGGPRTRSRWAPDCGERGEEGVQ